MSSWHKNQPPLLYTSSPAEQRTNHDSGVWWDSSLGQVLALQGGPELELQSPHLKIREWWSVYHPSVWEGVTGRFLGLNGLPAWRVSDQWETLSQNNKVNSAWEWPLRLSSSHHIEVHTHVNVHMHTEKRKESHNKDKGLKPDILLKVMSALLLQNPFLQTLGLTDTLLYFYLL